jgi:peptidoglycan/xylan/chitin deacetylase (PgdA/CDA1 family)
MGETGAMSEPEGNSVVGVDPGSGSVVLTYDDGPTPGVTDRLLTVLADAGASATFFVLLTRARRNPELLRDLLAAGHEIGLHGRDHQRLTTVDPDLLPGILKDARQELEDLASVPVALFRPPYGAQDAAVWHAVRAADLTPVLWSLHCADWLDVPLDERLTALRSGPLAGAVVLLHDGFAGADDGVDDGPAPPFDRCAVTSAVLAEIATAGLTARSLGAALQTSTAVRRPWFDEG